MKSFFVIILSVYLFTIISCSKDNSPTSPEKPKTIVFSDYQYFIDEDFIKVWSDSSWEKFNRTITLNGVNYFTIINSDGHEYFYNTQGYAGFKPAGESIIIFDYTMPGLPDTLVFGEIYRRSTTFSYQNFGYLLTIEQRLIDTVSVGLSFGVFNPCLWITSKGTVSSGGQSEVNNSEVWLAKGPGDIRIKLHNGQTISMVRGIVNGQGWGMELPKVKKVLYRIVLDGLRKATFKPE